MNEITHETLFEVPENFQKTSQDCLSCLKQFACGLLLFLKLKIIYDYMANNNACVFAHNLISICLTWISIVLTDCHIHNKRYSNLRLVNFALSLCAPKNLCRSCFVFFQFFISMELINEESNISFYWNIFSGLYGMLAFIRDAKFACFVFILSDITKLLPSLLSFNIINMKKTLFEHIIVYAGFIWLCYSIELGIKKQNKCCPTKHYYTTLLKNVLRLIKRPFVMYSMEKRAVSLQNKAMQLLLCDAGFSCFTELAEALRVQTQLFTNLVAKITKKNFNMCLPTLSEFVEQFIKDQVNKEKEKTVNCELQSSGRVEKFAVTIYSNEGSNEIAFFISKIKTKDLVRQRKEQNRVRNLLLRTLSHNIRNPLAGIMYLVDKLHSSSEHLPEISSKTSQLKVMTDLLHMKVDDLLDFALILEGELKLKRSFVSVGQLLNELKHILSQHIDDAPLRLNIELGKNVPETIFVDRERLLRVLCHLGLNSLKYTQRGFISLNIEFNIRKEEICFSLLDTGIGMSPERARTIEEFIDSEFIEAASQSYIDDSEGHWMGGLLGRTENPPMNDSETGFGLYITGKICEKLGSKLSVKGMEGHGTCFSFQVHVPIRKYMSTYNMNDLVNIYAVKTPEVKCEYMYEENKDPYEFLKDQRSILSPSNSSCCLGDVAEELPDLGEISERSLIGDENSIFIRIKKKKGRHMHKNSLFSLQLKEENKSTKILVVDDQQINRYVLKEHLKKISSFEIDEAVNGQEALDLIYLHHYSIVFMDIDMPIMNGYEAVRKIRELALNDLKYNIPVIAVTAYDTADVIGQSSSNGFNEVLLKPVSLATMRVCIQTYLRV